MFADAKVLEAPVAKTKASRKTEVQIDGVEKLASIDLLIKNLEALKTTVEGEVKTLAKEHFITEGIAKRQRPNNFRGVDGNAEASCELRKRSSRSILTEDEINMLIEYNIPFETITDVQETFVINPAYASDQKILGKLEKAFKNVKDLPQDLILRQQGATRKVVSDETIDVVCEKGLCRKFFDIVALVALKPKMENPSVADAFELARSFFGKK